MSQFLKNCRTVLTLPDADTGPHRPSPGRASCTPTEDSAAGKVHVQKRQWFPPFHPRHRTHRPARTCTGRQRTSLQPQGKVSAELPPENTKAVFLHKIHGHLPPLSFLYCSQFPSLASTLPPPSSQRAGSNCRAIPTAISGNWSERCRQRGPLHSSLFTRSMYPIKGF